MGEVNNFLDGGSSFFFVCIFVGGCMLWSGSTAFLHSTDKKEIAYILTSFNSNKAFDANSILTEY